MSQYSLTRKKATAINRRCANYSNSAAIINGTPTVFPLPVWYSGPGKQSEDNFICSNAGQGSGSYTIECKVNKVVEFSFTLW